MCRLLLLMLLLKEALLPRLHVCTPLVFLFLRRLLLWRGLLPWIFSVVLMMLMIVLLLHPRVPWGRVPRWEVLMVVAIHALLFSVLWVHRFMEVALVLPIVMAEIVVMVVVVVVVMVEMLMAMVVVAVVLMVVAVVVMVVAVVVGPVVVMMVVAVMRLVMGVVMVRIVVPVATLAAALATTTLATTTLAATLAIRIVISAIAPTIPMAMAMPVPVPYLVVVVVTGPHVIAVTRVRVVTGIAVSAVVTVVAVVMPVAIVGVPHALMSMMGVRHTIYEILCKGRGQQQEKARATTETTQPMRETAFWPSDFFHKPPRTRAGATKHGAHVERTTFCKTPLFRKAFFFFFQCTAQSRR